MSGGGQSHVYTSPEPLTFLRAEVTVDRIDRNRVLLTRGPPAGSRASWTTRGRDGASTAAELGDRAGRPLMRWIVARSLRFRWLVVFAAAALTALGIAQIPSAKVDVFPEFAPPRVEIQTAAVGSSSNEVEELITVPIEQQLNGLPGLEQLRSKSVAQLSSHRADLRARDRRVASRGSSSDERLRADRADAGRRGRSPPFMMPALSATSPS